jgi:hypothetical protein
MDNMLGISFSCYLPKIKKRIVVHIIEGDLKNGTGYYLLNSERFNVKFKNGNIN